MFHRPLDIHNYQSLSEHYPKTTNNLAELLALSIAADHACQAAEHLTNAHEHTPPVHFFVDNQYAINTATRSCKNRKHKAIIATLLQHLDRLSTLTDHHIHWVPGHAEILGNEIADWLAKGGQRALVQMIDFR